MNLVTIVKRKKEQTEEELKKLLAQEHNFPQGELCCAKNGTHYKWYLTGGKYIPKKKLDYVKKLAKKKYFECRCKDLQREIKACEAYIKIKCDETELSQELLKNVEFARLLDYNATQTNEKIKKWLEQEEIKNTKYPEKLTVNATNGKKVRSKSEAFIDLKLFSYGIPFKYEAPLIIGGNIFYPDFTIMHPVTTKIYYWEHLGIMDELSYARKQYEKLKYYSEHGIIIHDNLILTFETKQHPLNLEEVTRIIEDTFLS